MKDITLLKGDYIIIVSVIGLAFVLFYFTLGSFSGDGDIVEIYLNNEIIHSLPINKEETILIEDKFKNTIVIKNNSVSVIHSTCPDGVCENFGSINGANESIICMPNRLIVKIVGNSEEDIDIIV